MLSLTADHVQGWRSVPTSQNEIDLFGFSKGCSEFVRDGFLGLEVYVILDLVTSYIASEVTGCLTYLGYASDFTFPVEARVVNAVGISGAIMTPQLWAILFAKAAIIPIVEEFFFREVVHLWLGVNEETDAVTKFAKMALSGMIFGFCHIFPSAGALNVSIFITMTIVGTALAYLRDYTGNRTAGTIVHMSNNFVQVFRIIDRI